MKTPRKLSKAELLTRLEALEKKNQILEKKNQGLEEKTQDLEKKNKELLECLANVEAAARDLDQVLRSIAPKARELLGENARGDLELPALIANTQARMLSILGRAELCKYQNSTGRDANLTKDRQAPAVAKQAAQATAEAMQDVVADAEKANATFRATKRALNKLNISDSTLAAAKEIVNFPAPARKIDVPKKSPGRQTAPANARTIVKQAETPEACPKCGGELVKIGIQIHKLKGTVESLSERIANLEQEVNLFSCTKCHTVVSSLNADTQMPLTAESSSTVSMDFVIEALYLQQHGIPLNRVHELLYKDLHLGHDTLNKHQKDWMEIYGNVLLKAILQRVSRQKVLLCDETPYNCLSMSGKGNCKDTNPESKATQGYVVGVGCPANLEQPFALYYPMRGRSADAIAGILGDFTEMDTLCSDAYAGYDALIKKEGFENLKRASCLVHWRRAIIKAVEFDLFDGEVGKLTVKEAEALFSEKLKEKHPNYLLICVIEAIRKIYAHESALKRLPNESEADHLARVLKTRQKYAKPLMDNIDTIIKSLAEKHLDKKGAGKYQTKGGASHLTKALTYYMNNREELRLFLGDPRIPCDTNAVERMLRPVAVLENATNFRQSEACMKVFCDSFSLIETAQLNGIEKPDVWLKKFSRALFKHCYEAAWTEEIQKGKNPNRKMMSWKKRFAKHSASFDVTPWLPWNYKDPLPQSVA